jgi:protein-tyrosine phosphatase
MRFAIVFITLGVAFVVLGAQVGGWGWLLAWPGVSAIVIGAGYARLGARVFGKRRDGRMSPPAAALHLPYFLVTLWVWHVLRIAVRENAADQVAPDLWVARRPFARELPPGAKWLVDLTAEFVPARGVRGGWGYVCYPTLDGHVCDDAAFARAVREVAALDGGVVIHCAQGHGRSAALAAGVLLARGIARDAAEAERIVVAGRPRVRLKASQRRLLERVGPALIPAQV